MKILVTGSNGFLGKFLCVHLEKEGHLVSKVVKKECDLTKENSLSIYNDILFDRIYHLAAWTQAGDFCLYHPGEQWLINQKINTNVLDWWQKKQPQALLIAMGTSCGYDPSLPLKEEFYLSGQPIESLFTYAMTKRMLLSGLIALNKQYGLNYLYLIPSTLYGPEYHLDGRQMHFIFDLIRKILRGKFLGEPVVLWGNGEQKRELVHVSDFIEIASKLVSKEKNKWINLGAGKEFSIKDFAREISSIVEYDYSKIKFDTSKYVGAKSKILSVENLQKILPNYTLTPLKEGLEQTINWFIEKKAYILAPVEN